MGGERILHFSTIFDDMMDDAHCSACFYHFTLYSHERKIHHIRTGCWITSIIPIFIPLLDSCTQVRGYKASISSLCFKA